MTTEFLAIAAHPDSVFSYLADPSHLPAWAPTFAESVRREGDASPTQGGVLDPRAVAAYALGSVATGHLR
jgi:uncharacterized protein YndB with AHSA1/START domain